MKTSNNIPQAPVWNKRRATLSRSINSAWHHSKFILLIMPSTLKMYYMALAINVPSWTVEAHPKEALNKMSSPSTAHTELTEECNYRLADWLVPEGKHKSTRMLKYMLGSHSDLEIQRTAGKRPPPSFHTSSHKRPDGANANRPQAGRPKPALPIKTALWSGAEASIRAITKGTSWVTRLHGSKIKGIVSGRWALYDTTDDTITCWWHNLYQCGMRQICHAYIN